MACTALHVEDCTCRLNDVWSNDTGSVVIYPRSKLIACSGLLVRYFHPTRCIFGVHRLERAPRIRLASGLLRCIYVVISDNDIVVDDGDWANAHNIARNTTAPQNVTHVDGVGIARVRTLQRWFRRVLCQRRQERVLAVLMAAHGRVGAASLLNGLDENLLMQICTS